MNKDMLTVALAAALFASASTAQAQGGGELYGKGARIDFNEEGTRYMRFISWLQMWTRVMEMNPGTTVDGNPSDVEADVALRRARLIAYGQITDDVLILLHMGINNQTFRIQQGDPFKPQLFFHDAWVEYDVLDEFLSVGSGIHYWHGISRQTNGSTLNFLTIDAPIINWPLIEGNDQFARQLGVYAKGKILDLDYRVALNRPFETRNADPASPDQAVFNNNANTWSTAGYFKWEFLENEGNLLPYTVGSYLGTKKVFNIGAGYYYQPNGTARASATGGDRVPSDIFLFGADVFFDSPLGSVETGGALTALFTFYYFDFGPNFLRNIGISNIGDTGSGSAVNGRGNGYPVIGTGTSLVLEVGYLLPTEPLGGVSLQPYFRTQLSFFEALNDELSPMLEGGVNWLLIGHHAKLTLHYRARPIFLAPGDMDGFASEGILQAMVYF